MSEERKKHIPERKSNGNNDSVPLLMAIVKTNATQAVCAALCIVLVIISSTVSAVVEESMYLSTCELTCAYGLLTNPKA